jgi:putative transposase
LHPLDSFAALEKLISFYVEEYNSVIPHAAFAGQTPDEMYFGRGEQVPANLAVARARAREARLKANRNLSCQSCKSTLGAPPDIPDSSAISSVLHLQPENSRMF